jgi:hypothetical protein
MLETAVQRLILFGGRLILLDNRLFFPYHKWFAFVKPEGLIETTERLLKNKSPENVDAYYNMIKNHKEWVDYSKHFPWSDYCLRDIETLWMRGEEFIENI